VNITFKFPRNFSDLRSLLSWSGGDVELLERVVPDAAMHSDYWHKLFKSTMREVEFFRRRVREGVLVEDCQAFARYVEHSGIIELMEQFPNPGGKLAEWFPYSAQELREAVKALNDECCSYYRGRTRDSEGTPSGANKSDLEAIDAKLNLIGGLLSEVVSVKRRIGSKPRLRVLPSPGIIRSEDAS
jgi:hypothetical protein